MDRVAIALDFTVALMLKSKVKKNEFDNNGHGFKELKDWLTGNGVAEARICYEKLCAYDLLTNGLQVYIIQAKWIKDYVRSLSITAKIDKIDSSIIARYISNPDTRVNTLASNHVSSLRELLSRREQLVEILKIQKTQKQQITNSGIAKQMGELIELLQSISNLMIFIDQLEPFLICINDSDQ